MQTAPTADTATASHHADPSADQTVLGLSAQAWPIERLVVVLAGGVTLFTLFMGRRHHPRWRLMTGFIAGNLVAQGTVGWCPASLFMRRLGFRRAIDRPCARS